MIPLKSMWLSDGTTLVLVNLLPQIALSTRPDDVSSTMKPRAHTSAHGVDAKVVRASETKPAPAIKIVLQDQVDVIQPQVRVASYSASIEFVRHATKHQQYASSP
jgi:hypothetical protein